MKNIKAFLTKDSFATPTNLTTSEVYELSEISQTYSKHKEVYYSSTNPEYCLTSYKASNSDLLTQLEIDNIMKVVISFNNYLSSTSSDDNLQNKAVFLNNYNSANTLNQVTDFSYSLIVEGNGYRIVDYVSFKVSDVMCQIWCKDENFKVFYPDYDLDIVMPFSNFADIVLTPAVFVTALQNFDTVGFVDRIGLARGGMNSTFTRLLNIPYVVPGTSTPRNCYFGFNIYGIQGNFEHILKLELYDFLVNLLGVPGSQIEQLFPTILNINEFFMVPRWDKIAIPTQTGQIGINSQIALTYNKEYDTEKFIKVINDPAFIRANTYNVPVEYNNLYMEVTNGKHSVSGVKQFDVYYKDLMSVNSNNIEFSRMSSRTQRFITLLEHLLNVCDSATQSEMFNKIIATPGYRFSIITRNTVTYLSILFEDHQYYMVPKYISKQILSN